MKKPLILILSQMKNNFRQWRFGMLLSIIIAITFVGCKKHVELVKDGKSQYVIVIQSQSTAQVQRAATLLQKYIEKMSGCKLPVVDAIPSQSKGIFIREVDGLKYDGYRISTSGNGSIYIDGGKSKGCIYGAIVILDKYLGCHLYSPKYKVIPESRNLQIPAIDEADSTMNSLRITFTLKDYSEDEDLLDWHRTSNWTPPFAEGYYVHTFTHRLVPADVFFKDHPEYFAYIDGHRVPDQLCMSNADVVKEVIKQLEKDMQLQPDHLIWSVSQADGPLYCQCEQCKKTMEEEQSVAGPIIRFVNQVAKEFPDKIISTLAYYYSMVPPVVTKPLDNVQIMYCGGDLAAWGKVAKHLYVWNYMVNYFHYQCPYPSLFHAQPQIKDQMSKGANQFFLQGNIENGMEFAELRLYLYSRLAWNPDIDVSATINVFLKDYYGAAAPYIRKYIDRLTEEYENTKDIKSLIINTPPTYYQDTYLSQKNLEEYNAIFDQAEKIVQGNRVLAQRVHLARMPLNFAAMEIAKHNMYGPQGWWDSTATIRNTKMDVLFEDFYTTIKNAGIIDINENAYTIDDYKKHTMFTTLNEAAIGNMAYRKKVTVDSIPPANLHRYYTNDLSMLTDGVRGDPATRNLFWLIWPAKEFNITIDLETVQKISSVEMGALWGTGPTMPPAVVECFVSKNERDGYTSIGKQGWHYDQPKTGEIDWRYVYSFKTNSEARYVKLKIIRHDRAVYGRKAGMPARTYIDEIEVR